MSEIHEPESNLQASERLSKCRLEIESAMLKLIEAATKLGWSEVEVTMALADAAEDRVIHLARARARAH